MDFESFSQKAVERIDKELKRLLDGWRKEAGKIDKSLLPLVDEFIKACRGGKRIRGVLVVLGYQLGKLTTDYRLLTTAEDSRRKTVDIYRVAAAYEIFHSALLAHDDIIDQDPVRRGQPSLYQALGGDHHGISLAITLADAGFFLAIKIISESQHLGGVKALEWFSQIMLDTSLGQILDIEKGDSLTVAKYKTAKYSVAGPLVLGAILGGGGEFLKNLAEFGENLGIAFQIQDDILDSEATWIGGVGSAKKEAEKYKNKALKVLPRITKDPKMSKILKQMGEYLVQRTK